MNIIKLQKGMVHRRREEKAPVKGKKNREKEWASKA